MAPENSSRTRLLRLAAGAAFLVITALAVLIVVGNSGDGAGGDPNHVKGSREVDRMLRGIPQYGLILGQEDAPVELIEYGDLQCPVCRHFAEKILPPIIQGPVRKGQVKLAYCNFVILGDQSAAAGVAALAAGEEKRGWNYLELFYRNQGEEESGYADEGFLRAVAKAAGVKHMDAWDKRRKALESEPKVTTELARKLGFSGTPSFAIAGPGTDGLTPLGTVATTGDLEDAIEEAAS